MCINFNFLHYSASGVIPKEPPNNPPIEPNEPNETDGANDAVDERANLIPLVIEDEKFERFYGWLDDQTILYSSELSGEHRVYSYHLFSGNSELIFSSPAPIINVLIHQDQQKLFFHTSQYTHAANIYFTDLEGNLEYTTEIESYELAFEWNEQNASSMMITAFFEDWSYNVYHLNISSRKLEEVPSVQPFIKWYGEDRFLQQEWNEEDVEFFAAITVKELSDLSLGESLKEDVYRYDVLADHLMTITVPPEDMELFEYEFYNQSMERIAAFQTANLTQYSDWLLPFYYYDGKNNEFLTFAPKQHGNSDEYAGGFRLLKIDIDHNSVTELIDDLDNKPILCSPEGLLCLYGYQFDQILNLETGELTKLVQ